MRDALLGLRLTGAKPGALLVAVAVVAGLLALWWRGRARLRRVLAAACVVAVVGATAVYVNTRLDAYPTAADLFGVPRYPAANSGQPSGAPPASVHPKGQVVTMSVPDTASHFGTFDAQVWLPPQYFTSPVARFPVVVLTSGNPGQSTDWLDDGGAAAAGLAVAVSGHPVILVMPTVLQQPTGDSLCVDTALEGNAETYVVQDVVAAADSQLRTVPDARHRAIGGLSMGGFCALNLGLRHPDVFSSVLSFSSLTVCQPDAIDGGNEELFGGGDWQAQVAANSPAVYYPSLDASKGPALWLDVGSDETELVGPLQTLAAGLTAKGFVVEMRVRPGGHDFATWRAALAESLPWAAERLAP